MNYIDIFISIFLIYGFIKGLYKGFIIEVASVIGLVLGIYLATQYNSDLSNYLISKQYFNWKEGYIIILSNVILFILTILIVSILGKVATKLVKLVALGLFNKILGSVFGLLKNILILVIVIFVFNLANNSLKIIEQDKLELSIYYKPLNGLSRFISGKFVK
jgi:membrane protein required for colicin V production